MIFGSSQHLISNYKTIELVRKQKSHKIEESINWKIVGAENSKRRWFEFKFTQLKKIPNIMIYRKIEDNKTFFSTQWTSWFNYTLLASTIDNSG